MQRGHNREPCFFGEEDFSSYLHWLEEALGELEVGSGAQFCPRCVAALVRILPLETVSADLAQRPKLLAVS